MREALSQGADAVAIVSRDDAWPLRAALLVRHLDPDVPIVATIFDPATGRELEQEIGNCTIASLAEIVAPSLAGPCLGDDLAAVLPGDQPCGLTWADGEAQVAPLPEVRARRMRALATAILRAVRPQRGARLLRRRRAHVHPRGGDVAAAVVLEQDLVDAYYGAVKTLVTVDPNPEVQQGPSGSRSRSRSACSSHCSSPRRSPAGSWSG